MGNLHQPEVDEQIKKVIEAGVNFIDTANIYSIGLSETMIGKAIKNLSLNRDNLVLATKVRGSMGKGENNRGLSRFSIPVHRITGLHRRNKKIKQYTSMVPGANHPVRIASPLRTLPILKLLVPIVSGFVFAWLNNLVVEKIHAWQEKQPSVQ